MRSQYPSFNLFIGLILTASVLTACGKSPQQAAQGSQAPQVGVVTLKAEPLVLSKELPGRTSAYEMAEIRPQVTGIVLKREFTEGSLVKRGQVLYQIDPASFEAAVASAKASVARAQANLATAKAKARRYDGLIKKQTVSQQDYDEVQASYQQAQADLAAAQAQLKTANINLAYTRVSAPISGRISKSSVTPGALVTANQEAALATISQLDPIYVDLTQASSELLRLKQELAQGQLAQDQSLQAKAKLILEDGSEYAREGQLQFSEVTVDPSTGSVTLRAIFPNPDQLLLPGMYVRARINEGIRPQGLLVPQRGVSRNTKGEATALIVNTQGQVEARVLQTSRTQGAYWVVDAGLNPGDKVIVEGLQKIRPGMPVTPVDASSSAQTAPAAH